MVEPPIRRRSGWGDVFSPPSRSAGEPALFPQGGVRGKERGFRRPHGSRTALARCPPSGPGGGEESFPFAPATAWAAERGQYNSTASLAPWGGPRLASIGLMENRQRRNRDLRHGRRSLPVMSRGYKPRRYPFTREAISSAKFSCFFSMPSPFSNRTAVLKVMAPPSSLAAWAI